MNEKECPASWQESYREEEKDTAGRVSVREEGTAILSGSYTHTHI